MIRLFERKDTNITISEFYDNHKAGKYNYNASYQRRGGVWAIEERSFLIDTIFKNYPIPPIFLRPKVDSRSGKTQYDVVDGKQRLQAIISFIENEIPLTSDFADDVLFDPPILDTEKNISGMFFDEIRSNIEHEYFTRQFWTYSLSVDYLYENDDVIVASAFDRLNRNGQPLKPQELRNAQFSASSLVIGIKELAELPYWVSRYDRLRIERMAEQEFISELFFLVAEGDILELNQEILDEMYKKYEDVDISAVIQEFKDITDYLDALSLDYQALKKLNWTTHLYGLFSFGWHCKKKGISPISIRDKLSLFYGEYFSHQENTDAFLIQYKNSCSSRTRSRGQRVKRLDALLGYCGLPR